jgi:mannosyltransferase OCH1-like enzyme
VIINKKIHYVWIGNKEKSDFINACIRNWKLTLPDYEIIEWNNNNIDLDEIFKESKFIKECYEKKLWAYVSDFIRIKVLNQYGGIYLDTDITLEKDLTPLLKQTFFIGKEDEKYINGAIIGTIQGHPILNEILNFYRNDIYNHDIYTMPQIITHVFNNNPELIHDINVYPVEYFYPYSYKESFSPSKITNNTYCIHWWGKSWNGDLSFLKTKHLNGMKKTTRYIDLKLQYLWKKKVLKR